MEPKNKKLRFSGAFLVLMIVFQSCWTGESSIIEQDSLIDNFKIVLDKNNEKAGFTLVLNLKEDYFQTVKERCKSIHYDSSNIYIKSLKNSFDIVATYSQIKLISYSTLNKSAKYETIELSEVNFKKRIRNCEKCITINYDN